VDGKAARQILTHGCFMASMDLKEAYYLIPVAKSDRKFLRFSFEGKLYEFTCLPFGLNRAPYTFTKLLKPIVSYLRERGYLSIIYLDDIMLLGNSYADDCAKNVQVTRQLFEKLGFIINNKKSQTIPSTKCRFLGFIYDSMTMSIELPKEKEKKIAEIIESFRKMSHCTIREFAGLIGILGSSCIALKYGWVHMKDFERAKFRALKMNNENFESRMSLGNDLKILNGGKQTFKKLYIQLNSLKQF